MESTEPEVSSSNTPTPVTFPYSNDSITNSTQQLTYYITNNTPCIFAKFGDGEYAAAQFLNGGNCDQTPYTARLGLCVRSGFLYTSQQQNAMIGAWHEESNKQFWYSLGNPNVNWVDFHTVLIDRQRTINDSDRLNLFTAIKESSRKKIYVANVDMSRSKDLLGVDYHVCIHPSNWFECEYDNIFNEIKEQVVDDSNTMILTSAGMAAKYLISELHKLYPNAIYIDVGSGLDLICAKKSSRDYNPSYEDVCNYLRPMLPANWDQ